MFQLTLVKSDRSARYNITPLVGEISWDSEFTITSALEFDMAYSDAKFFPTNPCELGDLVILTKDAEEVFRGIVIDEDRNGRDAIQYSAYDVSWYLGQSKSVYQFNRVTATHAISKILDDFGIPIGSIITMPTLIDEIYIQETPDTIIQKIIDSVEQKEGYKINGEMRGGKLYLEKRRDLLIQGRFQLAANFGGRSVTDVIGSPARKRTIEDMRNRIRLIVDDEETEYEITAQAENGALIEQYGLLEETIKIDAEDAAKSRQVAKILLQRLGKVHETVSVKLMGDVRFKAGYLFDLSEPITGLHGRFMIVTAKHSVSKQIHTMDLELALPEDVE
ncbi:hypothetical protein [Marinicrinis lubricantis]|uniref:YqbQ/XkdQ domain-containing protein n=1 Tax=Marinicrinis lubricantis TaxID=2086470 RepID=A0ABW1IHU7_9BACL